MNLIKKTLSVVCLGLSITAIEAALLEVDLSVVNQITIAATEEVSLVTASGPDFFGVYLEGFFDESIPSIFSSSLDGGFGDLTSAQNSTNGEPLIFRLFSAEPGLNLYSFTSEPVNSNFLAGSQAFTGSATWNVDEGTYQSALKGSLIGDIYFPASKLDDIGGVGVEVLGGWEVIAVPEPNASLAMGCFCAVLISHRLSRRYRGNLS